ncbi:MAG TPA: chemotaxis protein CheC [Gammaproteobacteria bacterium]|nr:chemotaxis protein CheC [Gammaproteobacteria bacterium]
MNLTHLQQDALAEMANISASRAAKQLSVLLRDSIDITVPRVEIARVDELSERVAPMAEDPGLVCVYQEFSGDLRGRLHLVFHDEGSQSLVQALVGEAVTVTDDDLRAYEHEAMTEIGNIIISTFAAMLADLLGTEFRLGVPHYAEGRTEQVLCGLPDPEQGEDKGAIVIETVLRAAEQDVSGALMVVLRLHSLEQLLQRLDGIVADYSEGIPMP